MSALYSTTSFASRWGFGNMRKWNIHLEGLCSSSGSQQQPVIHVHKLSSMQITVVLSWQKSLGLGLTDHQEERGIEKGSSWQSTLKGRDRAIVNQTNFGTVSKATLGKLLTDRVECTCPPLWTYFRERLRHNLELNWTTWLTSRDWRQYQQKTCLHRLHIIWAQPSFLSMGTRHMGQRLILASSALLKGMLG